VKEGINIKSQALKVGTLAGNHFELLILTNICAGLPPETLRIAAQTLDYLERNAEPVIHPGDEFLSSFVKEDTHQPIIDEISQTHLEEEKIEDLKEVIEIEEDQEEEGDEEVPSTPELYHRILSDKEKRKMEKVRSKAEKDAEKERKRIEKEILKAEREKDKADRKMRAVVAKLRPFEVC